MSGTGIALTYGTYAASQALLIVAATVVPVCLTVITLVVLVEPRDRVQAIRELAPALFFTLFRRRQAGDEHGSVQKRVSDEEN
jgi:hypothetical protein